MKKLNLAIVLAAFLVSACNNDAKVGAEADKADSLTTKDSITTTTPPMDSAAQMQAWMNYMTPGEMHKLLAKDEGTWNEEVTMYMDPSAPPTKGVATAVVKMIYGGLYQVSTHRGTMMNMPFEGTGTVAYNNARKVFETTWIDNMGSGVIYMEGTYDSTAKTVNYKGTSTDPLTGQKLEVKEKVKILDENNQLVEMFDVRNGKDVKTMEIKLTRKS